MKTDLAVPTSFELSQNFPNPFNNSTSIKLTVAAPGYYQLHIVDTSGRIIYTLMENIVSMGAYTFLWDGTNNLGLEVSSGTYFTRVIFNGGIKQIKMTLQK